MPQSLAEVYLHLVFSTKNRVPFLRDEELQKEVHAYLAGGCRNMSCPSLIVGGVEDHVHVLCRLSRTLTIADLVQGLKKESSKWIKRKAVGLRDFHWQAGYGAFSAGPRDLPRLRRYIANQEKHHRKMTFKEEFIRLLEAHDVDFDERYVWD